MKIKPIDTANPIVSRGLHVVGGFAILIACHYIGNYFRRSIYANGSDDVKDVKPRDGTGQEPTLTLHIFCGP